MLLLGSCVIVSADDSLNLACLTADPTVPKLNPSCTT